MMSPAESMPDFCSLYLSFVEIKGSVHVKMNISTLFIQTTNAFCSSNTFQLQWEWMVTTFKLYKNENQTVDEGEGKCVWILL